MATTCAQTVPKPLINQFREWMVKRGVLYGITQIPLIVIILGYFLRWTIFPIANIFTIYLCFVLLLFWLLIRLKMSKDPEEPVHHFPKYLLWSLVPLMAYNLLGRMAMHYPLGMVFWDNWYDFGAELTSESVDQWSSFIPGTIAHTMQGYVLALGYYILFRRYTLLNTLIYVFIFLSTVYTLVYSTFITVDWTPPTEWFFAVWWAHLMMAFAAWVTPKVFTLELWNRLRTRTARALAILVGILIFSVPFTLVAWRAGTWQLPRQREIDATVFNQGQLVMKAGPTLVSSKDEAHYQFSLGFGARPSKDYIDATKALDAGPIRARGHLLSQGKIIGWCSAYIKELETPNSVTDALEDVPAARRMEYTDIPVECVGPANAAANVSSATPLDVRWTAAVQLVEDRETDEQEVDDDEQARFIPNP